MLDKRALLIVGISMVLLLGYLLWSQKAKFESDILMYPQVSQQSLVPLSPKVLGERLRIVGYLDVRLQQDENLLLALLPNNAFDALNLREARGIGSDLISTSELEYPSVRTECIGSFVEIDGVPRQQHGGLAISLIYSVRRISVGEEVEECLLNKPGPGSIVE